MPIQPPCGSVLDRVADQVLEHAAQRRLVAGDGRQVGRRCRLDLRSARLSMSAPDAPSDVVEQWPRSSTGRARRALAGLNAGELENLLDHLGQAAPLAAHERPRTCGSAPSSWTTPSARLSPAERITASGVLSSCDTAATNSICCRASSCARRVGRDEQSDAGAEQPRMLVLTSRFRRRTLLTAASSDPGRMLDEQTPFRGVTVPDVAWSGHRRSPVAPMRAQGTHSVDPRRQMACRRRDCPPVPAGPPGPRPTFVGRDKRYTVDDRVALLAAPARRR